MPAPHYPILYSFRRCPYAMRARLALEEASIVYELREVVLNNKPAQMIALSGKGTVPVFQLQNGAVIDESIEVMHWALGQSDPHAWLAADDTVTKRLIEQNDSSFKEDLDHYKYHVRHPEHPREYYRGRAERFLAELEDLLALHDGIGLIAERATLADVAIFPFLRQFAHVDRNWFDNSGYGLLEQWLRGFEQSHLFLSIMKKYPAWVNGDPVTTIGGREQ
jgi:glutathione S-transferase